MKIMHIAGGGDRGGAKPHIISLCRKLMNMHELQLISMRTGEFADEAIESGVNTKIIYSKFTPADYFRLIKHVKKEKPDIVHCHGAKANTAGALLKLFCGSTIVTTIHSDWRLDYMGSFIKRNTIGRLNSFVLKFFDYYVTVSDTFRKMLIDRGFSPTKLMTIYNGIDFEKTGGVFDRSAYLKNCGLDYEEGDIVLGIPARLSAVKDIPTLLRAFAKARRTNKHIKLLVGGDGEEMPRLKALANELELGRNVCFMGWVNNVPDFFKACDIDVLCSISESFPYSVLEGIREGCAVITSDVGGMRRLIDHGINGYIFAPGDVDTFTEYILDLSSDHEKRKLFAERLYDKASENYSLDSMSRTQSGIYDRIMKRRQHKGEKIGVLLCGAYGRGNSGDEAILKAIINTMRSIDPEMPITVMTRKPRETELAHNVKAVYIFNIPSFIRVMKRTKLYINGGGSLIQDVTSNRSLYFYLFTIWAAKKVGCRILMYGCGIGQITRKLNVKLSGKVLNKNVDIITLRDPCSIGELEAMGVTAPDIRLSADPAMSLSPAPDAEAEKVLADYCMEPDKDYLCFALRNWHPFTDYSVYSKAAEYAWNKYGMASVFFPIEQPKDMNASYEAASRVSTPHYIFDIPSQDNVELTIALMKKMRLVCAMRLHALVFSAAAGSPFIATSYDVKVDGFMDYAGCSDKCCKLSALTAEWLCDTIDKAMAERGSGEMLMNRLKAAELENEKAARELLA